MASPLVTIKASDCLAALRALPSSQAACVVADPPYFKVLGGEGSWDYQWRTADDYLHWCQAWLSEVFRCLRSNGHLWLWGYYDMLARCHPMLLSLGFHYRETVIWDKGMRAVAGRATRRYKQYPNVTELCVRYVRWCREELRSTLKAQQQLLGLSAREINRRLGVKTAGGGMWSIYTGKNVCAQIPTKERWDALMTILQLRIPYAEVEQVWSPRLGITNVWSDIPPDRQRVSPAQKPLEASRRLVLPTTRPGDLVLDLFAGSLSVAAVCHDSERQCIAVERDHHLLQKALTLRALPVVDNHPPMW